LYGLREDKEQVLRDLQDLGVAHLITVSERAIEAQPDAQRARRALRFLTGARHRWHQFHDRARFDAAAVESRALDIEARTRALAEERDALLHRIKQLAPWGDFELPEDPPPEVRFWFYIVPNHRLRAMPLNACWQVVHRDQRFSYVVVIAEAEPMGIPAARTHAGARALSAVRARLEAVYNDLDELEAERAREARWGDLLASSLDRLADEAAFERALTNATADDGPLFRLAAWVPFESLERVRELVQRRALAFAFRDPLPGERPPTLLDNRGVAAFGQDILGIYLVPAYGGWDPSPSIFWFFAVFFAVIVADAGYAALLAVGLAVAWRPLRSTALRRRARRFLTVAVTASVVFGVAVGSYFGGAPAPDTLAASLKLFDASDTGAYVTLSILLGAAQLIVANAALARHLRGAAALARIGWIIVIASALCWWLSAATPPILANAAMAGLALGGVLIAAFSADRGPAVGRVAGGALALTRSVGLFSDTLSYLRLFALGYAGAQLATAFNDLAGQAAQAAPGVGVLLAGLVLFLGHGANLGLAVASGVVHGLRLNLIEFVNWSVVAEGQPFQRFARKETDAWSNL
jgi:V/A-type H+-transporting ATPase subunit I